MPDKASEVIGIIGSGPIGQGLATLWAQAGYTVQLGARSPESARRVSVPSSVRVVSFEEAAGTRWWSWQSNTVLRRTW